MHASHSPHIVVTTAAQLRVLVDETVDRAVERALARALRASRQERDAEWLTVDRAQAAYGVGRSTLHRWKKGGDIEWTKVGGRLYYRSPSGNASHT